MNMSTGKLNTVSANCPCVVCGRTAGFCKTNGEMHLCSTNTDGRKGEVVNGLAFLGTVKDWGQWKEHKSRQSLLSDQSFNKLKQTKAAPKPAPTKSMPLEERDRHYRAILSGLKLHAGDKANLLKRGFNQAQIDRSLFKSVGQWQKVDGATPLDLPGVLGNHSLNVQAGYLCPVTSLDGLIVGLQLRLRNPESGAGKYRWVSSRTSKDPSGATCHLEGENGPELPLAIYQPQHRQRNAIALCEGTGPKPFLASERLEIPTIGAASGNFLGSVSQLKAALAQFDPQQKGLVELYPDGGAVSNPSIMQKYQRTLGAIQEWGYSVRVGWWGQTTKADGDVDEIAVNTIKYISVEDFMGLAQENGGLKADSSLADAIAEAVASEVNNQNEVPKGVTFDAHCFARLFESGKGKWCVIDDVFYEYTGRGFWEKRDDNDVHRMIQNYSLIAYRWKQQGKGEGYEDHCFATDTRTSSAFRFCRGLLSVKKHQLKQGEGLLCFRNGTIRIKDGTVLPHDKSHYLTWAVDAEYTANAECPVAFKEFIRSTFGDDLLHPIRVITSMLIDPTAPSGYFPHLIGPSGSGKGTLLNLWASMFCEDHVRSGTSFGDLSSPEARHQNLAGARLYLLPDLGGYIQGIRPFYSLVQNESLTGRALYSSNAYQKRWGVKFAVASVSHLKIEDASDGWTRRAFPLPTQARNCPPDFLLEHRLQECKGQIISWAIALSAEKRNRDLERLLVTCKKIANARNDALLAGDSVRVFIDQCLRPVKGENKTEYRLGNKKLHAMFEAFCEKFGYSKMGFLSFVDRLRGILPEFYDAHTRKSKYDDSHAPVGLFDVTIVAGAFHSWTDDESGCLCNKKLCEEGGLEAFNQYLGRIKFADDDLDGDLEVAEWAKSQGKFAGTDPLTMGVLAVNGESCEGCDANLRVVEKTNLNSQTNSPPPPDSGLTIDNDGSGDEASSGATAESDRANPESPLATSQVSQPTPETPTTTGLVPATSGSERRFISIATNTKEEVEAYIAAHPCPDGARMALEQGHHIWL